MIPTLVQTAWLGDAVLSLAAVRLAARRSGRGVVLVTRPAVAPLFEGDPAVAAWVGFDKRGADAGPRGLLTAAARLRGALRGEESVGVLLQGSARSALLARAAGVRRLVAAPGAEARWLGASGPPTLPPLRPHDEAALIQAALPGDAGPLPADALLHLPPEAIEAARRRLPGAPRIGAVLGAAQATKRAPEALWRALLPRLGELGAVVLCGGPEDRAAAARLAPLAAADVTGEPLRDAAATLATCDVVVSGDTGLAHLAQAVGTPAVVLYGPTPAAPFARAWGPAHGARVAVSRGLACQPCSASGGPRCPLGHHACLAAAAGLEAAARREVEKVLRG
jgi:heptosyltransferase-2